MIVLKTKPVGFIENYCSESSTVKTKKTHHSHIVLGVRAINAWLNMVESANWIILLKSSHFNGHNYNCFP